MRASSHPIFSRVQKIPTKLFSLSKFIFENTLFDVLFLFNRGYALKVYVQRYRQRGSAPTFFERIVLDYGLERAASYIASLPKDRQEEFMSASAWSDDENNFSHFEIYSNALRGAHARGTEILKEEMLSVTKHNYPIYFLFQNVLPHGHYDVVEYGCGDARNYTYVSDALGDKKYFGIDINKFAIERAQKLYPENTNNFFYLKDSHEIAKFCESPPWKRPSAAILCYVLVHLTLDEQKELLLDCVKRHDMVVIYESINHQCLSNAALSNDNFDDKKANWIKILQENGMKLSGVSYHPIVQTADESDDMDTFLNDGRQNIVYAAHFGTLMYFSKE